MPSLFRRTISALKDQTSIGLARISSSDLDVAVLKATSHDELPVEERHITEVLLLSSSSPILAAACVRALSRRISRTHNWVVALKVLVLAFRLLRQGGPYFKHEAVAPLHSSPRRRLLDLSSFRDNCSPSPWDFTAFVRTFALYLDACLEAALLGKLDAGGAGLRRIHRPSSSAGGKLAAVLDRVAVWQRLLDRAISTRPTGFAQSSRLVQIALYPVVRETFDLYRGVSEGLSLLLDNFFHLQRGMCLETFNVCVTASKQFDELDSFYHLCRKIGVGRSSEYPSVQKISDTLLKALEEFSRNWQPAALAAASPKYNIIRSHLLEPWRNNSLQDIDQDSDTSTSHQSSTIEKHSTADWGSEFSDVSFSLDTHVRASFASSDSSMSNSEKWITKDLFPLHDEKSMKASNASKLQDWELALIKSMDEESNQSADELGNPLKELQDDQFMKAAESKNLFDQKTLQYCRSMHNPFLICTDQTSLAIVPWSSMSTPLPTFRAGTPSLEESLVDEAEIDPFSTSSDYFPARSGASVMQQKVRYEQRLWRQQQRKILAKNFA